MSFSGLAQFVLGVFSGIIILSISGFAAGYYLLGGMTGTPVRPVFPEERPQPAPTPSKAAEKPKAEEEPKVAEAEKPAEPEEKKEEPKEKLEPGAYRARVNWPDGLSLRDNPAEDAERIGSITYNQEMIILKTSEDGNWEQVRLPGSDEQGWVKAGNADRIDENEEAASEETETNEETEANTENANSEN